MNNIDKLLEKYFEGNTSLQEEMELHAYFAGEIEERHLQYQPIFHYFNAKQSEQIATITTDEIIPAKTTKRFVLIRRISIAASVAIVLGVGLHFFSMQRADFLSQSIVYVDGKKVKNTDEIKSEIINSINTVTDDSELIESQIDLLDDFLN